MFSYHSLSYFQAGAEAIRAALRCWYFSTAATFLCSPFLKPPQIPHSVPEGGQQGARQHSLVQEESYQNLLKLLFPNYYIHMKEAAANFIYGKCRQAL